MTDFTGTASDDNLDGTAGDDEFDLSQGGGDIARGLDGTDNFYFGAAFDPHDRVFGGAGTDALLLSGAYDITFRSKSIRNVEQIYMDQGFDYRLVLHNDNVGARDTLIVNASLLTGGNSLVLNGLNETDGNFLVFGGAGGDAIATGGGNDTIQSGDGDDSITLLGGRDTVNGGLGDDSIVFDGDGALDANDSIDGGGNTNTVFLSGDYSSGLTFKATTLTNIQTLTLNGGSSYAFNASHLVPGPGMLVNADGLGAHDTLVFDALGNDACTFILDAGAGNDTLTGGTGYDSFFGNGGADRMKGGGGPDTYYYSLVSDSTGTKYDTIVGFDALENFIWPSFPDDEDFEHATAVDNQVEHGALSTATFNADLEAAIGKHELGVTHAVLFTPDAGGLAGELFLIVEANGHAGYQANRDLVIHFDHAKHMNQFDLSNFSTAG